MFFQLLIAMLLGFTSPSTTPDTNPGVNQTSDVDPPVTGGDLGQNPPPKGTT